MTCCLRVLLLSVMGFLAAPGASAFSLFPSQGGTPQDALLRAARWADGHGLEDGIQVGVAPGFEASLGAQTPQEIALVRGSISAAFSAWENAALRFDISFDAPVVRGSSSGFEIDVIGLLNDDPAFGGQILFGLADPSITFGTRSLTNGMTAPGQIITSGDLFVNETLLLIFSNLLADNQERLDALQRLLMHEIGHLLGVGHPGPTFYDTDFDPLTPMILDPLDPFANLILSPFIDADSIVSNRVCGGGFAVCPALFFTSLRPDDRGALDALYPVVPEPRLAALLGLALCLVRLASRPSGKVRGSVGSPRSVRCIGL